MSCGISCTSVQKKLPQQKYNYPKQLLISIFISPVHILILTNDSYFFLLVSTIIVKKKKKCLKIHCYLVIVFLTLSMCSYVNLLPIC